MDNINDDQILDARDMAAEIAASHDEVTCKDIDKVLEQLAKPRTFADVLNQWTETMVRENKKAVDTETLLLLMRLGTLGQRLITEANVIGMQEMIDMAKGRL